MFGMRFWDSLGSPGVSCVKLPAAVAFPTDSRLLQRIEESRRALPANNMKPLRKRRELAPAPATPSATRERSAEASGCCVVPLARLGRVREGITVSAA
jgi:hypothetical protein